MLFFLSGAGVTEKRSHGVHLGVARCGVAAGAIDFFKDNGGLADAETRSAVFISNQSCKVSGLLQLTGKFSWIGPLDIQVTPVRVGKSLAQISDAVAQTVV